MARPKTYYIMLSDNDMSTLRKVIKDKKTCKTVLKRCQILLELDEVHGTGLTHSQIAHTYAVCLATITNIIHSYVKSGITDIVKYNISPNSSATLRKIDGRSEAHLVECFFNKIKAFRRVATCYDKLALPFLHLCCLYLAFV